VRARGAALEPEPVEEGHGTDEEGQVQQAGEEHQREPMEEAGEVLAQDATRRR
jgi:hypothetical protein